MSQRWSRRRVYLVLLISLLAICGLVYWGVDHFTQEPPNYTLVEQGLYMGGSVTDPPPRTSAVLNLCEKADPYQSEVHAWEPIRDGAPAPGIQWLHRQVEFIEAQRRAGRVVYVHCLNGISRSGMVIVAYFMRKNQWQRDQALAFVRSKRPGVRPNPAFMDLLSEWERAEH
jgi:hypothetical protein